MNKILIIIFSIVIAASLVVIGVVFFSGGAASDEPLTVNLRRVETPEQTQAEWPAAIHDPSVYWISPPDGINVALEKPATSEGRFTEIYAPSNVTDDILTSYWESDGFPGEITINLEGVYTIQTVCVRLNPSALWEARSQAFEILVSTDGVNFATAAPNEMHDFDPETGNIVIVEFDPVSAQFVRLIVTQNTASRTQGAQIAEIMIFE